MEYPPDIDRAIEGVEIRLGEIAIARAEIQKEWDYYQGLRLDFVYERYRRSRNEHYTNNNILSVQSKRRTL